MEPDDLEDREMADDACGAGYAIKNYGVVLVVIVALIGWGVSVEGRLHDLQERQVVCRENSANTSKRVDDLWTYAHDPKPKPEAVVALDTIKAEQQRHDAEILRLEDRVNNLHNYLMALPLKPKP